jgi:hypothetical protein
MFLDDVLETDQYMNEEDQDEVMETFDEVSHELSRLFNGNSKLHGTFWIGHHEADGSLGVTYSVRD